MTILSTSNRFKYEQGIGAIDFSSHTFKVQLMGTGFTFDPDNHEVIGDVSASQISSAGGYTEQTLSVDTAWAQDDVNDKGAIAWDNVSFTASGADFDDFRAAIIYDDSHASDVIVGCIDFEADLSVPDGQTFQLQSLGFENT